MPSMEGQLPPLPEDSEDESDREEEEGDDMDFSSDKDEGSSDDDIEPSRQGRSGSRTRPPSDKLKQKLKQDEKQASKQLAAIKKQLEKEKKKNLSLQRQNEKLQGDKPYESEDETVGGQKAKELQQLYASSTLTRPGTHAHGRGQAIPRGEFVKLVKKTVKPKVTATTRKAMYSIPSNISDDDDADNDANMDGRLGPDNASEANAMLEEDAPAMPRPSLPESLTLTPTHSRAPLADTSVAPMSQMTPLQVSADHCAAASRKRHPTTEPAGGIQPTPKRQHRTSSNKEQDQPNDRSGTDTSEVVHTSKKPKAGDYSENVTPLLVRACQEYEARIYGKSAFPESLAQIRHASVCLRHASRVLGVKTQFTASIGRVIKVRGSTIRGRSIAIVRKLVEALYGFARPEHGRPVSSNIKLSAYLLEDNRYMHKNIDNTDQYLAEHPIVPRVLQEVIFPQSRGTAAMGIVYEKYFNPISLNTLALIFSQVRHCILEWSSGKLVPGEYSEKIAMKEEAFTRLLAELQDWEDADPDFTKKLRTKMNLSNVQGQSAAPVPRLTAERKQRIAAHLATRTGDTDSEVEDEDEAEAGAGGGNKNAGVNGASGA
ncbi:hypothetical protein EV715DRAFT_294079 [Schizophyllum commune]